MATDDAPESSATPSRGAPDTAPPARRILTLHPVLVAAYPVLALWGANALEVPVADAMAVLWPVVAVAVVAWVVVAGLLASVQRPHPVAAAGLAVSIGAAMFLTAGRLMPDQPATIGLVAVVLVAVAGLVLAWRLGRRVLAPVTTFANVFAVVAVVLAAVQLRPALAATDRAPPVQADIEGAQVPARDIWYVIPDRYPRAETMDDLYGFDNSEFEGFLTDRGFTIQDRARANYPKTAHSLSATWNLDYVQDGLVPDPPVDGSDWRPLYDLLDDHLLGRTVTDAGFDYIHLGSWWGPTATAAPATETRNLSDTTEFAGVWRTTTAQRWLGRPDDEGLDNRRLIHDVTAFQLDELDRLVTEPHDRPRLVLAHVTLPHEPYVFDADGSYVTAEQERARTRVDNTVHQVEYVNARLTSLVDRLVTGDPATDPIIVIQSDEGPHPDVQYQTGSAMDWTEATDQDRMEKLRTFSAWYLPGVDEEPPEDITGVNTWRFILDRYFGTGLGLLDDRVYIYPTEQELYTYIDVTDDFD